MNMHIPLTPGRNRQLTRATFVGLVAGGIVFFVVLPILLGESIGPVLVDRTTFALFVLYCYTLFVLPFVSISVALFQPASRWDAFKISVSLSAALLIPFALLSYWLTAPGEYGESAYSASILKDLAALAAYQGVLALIASAISALLSPLLWKGLNRVRKLGHR